MTTRVLLKRSNKVAPNSSPRPQRRKRNGKRRQLASLIARAVALENVEVPVNLPWFLLSHETSEWATWSGVLLMASPHGLASLFVAAGRERRARCGFAGSARETSQRWKDTGWKLFPRGLKLITGRGRRAEGGEKWTQAWRKQFKRRWQNLTKNLRGQILWWNWERSFCEGFLFNRNGDKRKACFSNMLW